HTASPYVFEAALSPVERRLYAAPGQRGPRDVRSRDKMDNADVMYWLSTTITQVKACAYVGTSGAVLKRIGYPAQRCCGNGLRQEIPRDHLHQAYGWRQVLVHLVTHSCFLSQAKGEDLTYSVLSLKPGSNQASER